MQAHKKKQQFFSEFLENSLKTQQPFQGFMFCHSESLCTCAVSLKILHGSHFIHH